jgi:type VI secretion system secreted protein Hcp
MTIQMFLQLDGIEGESADSRHRGEIDITGWTWGLADPVSLAGPGGAGAGKLVIRDIAIQKPMDLASPLLMAFAAEGRSIAGGVITNRRASGGEFLVIRLSDIAITSVAETAAHEANHVAETITLAFRKIELDYRPTVVNGSLGPEKTFRWDVGKNGPV